MDGWMDGCCKNLRLLWALTLMVLQYTCTLSGSIIAKYLRVMWRKH